MRYNPVTRWLNQVQYGFESLPNGVMWADPSQMAGQSSMLSSNIDPLSRAGTVSVNDINYFATKLTGTAAMALMSVPTGFRGMIAIIPSAALTMVTGGTYSSNGIRDIIPFAVAAAMVANRVTYLVTDGLLWYPSAIT